MTVACLFRNTLIAARAQVTKDTDQKRNSNSANRVPTAARGENAAAAAACHRAAKNIQFVPADMAQLVQVGLLSPPIGIWRAGRGAEATLPTSSPARAEPGILARVDRKSVLEQHPLENGTRTIDATFHRADLTAANFSDLIVGQTMHSGKNQHLAVGLAQHLECTLEGSDLDPALLLGCHPCMPLELVVADLRRDMLARHDAAKTVAQDREQPSLEVGARRELVLSLQAR